MNNKRQYRLIGLATALIPGLLLIGCNTANQELGSTNTRPDTSTVEQRPMTHHGHQHTQHWPHQTAVNIGLAITGHPVKPEEITAQLATLEASANTQTETSTQAEPIEELDLWARMRQGYGLPDADHQRVERHLQWYAKHPEYLDRVIDRAEPFMHFILEEIDKRNMPTEIALLPIVESAFQPFAYSHGRAAGIWQFIPGTGKLYGLKQDWWYDGRRDVIASTHAALDYLTALNKHFKGDWLLALAAYNSGQGTVNRAIRKNRKRNRPTDYWHLRLPKETTGYVPRLLAISTIFAKPEKYSLQLRSLENKPRIQQVDTGSQLDLALAADMAGIELEQLYKLNPAYNRWATDPAGPHKLVLPIEKVEQFNQQLVSLPENERIKWKRHRIKEGQALSHIAKKYRTTVKVLKTVNNLRSNNIRAGKYLIIPVASRSFGDYKLSASSRQQKRLARAGKGKKTIYRVRKGDTFWDISRAHGVSVRKLAKWNGMAPRDPLKLGQKLVIYTQPGKKQSSSTMTLPIAAALPSNDLIRRIRYIVRKGDSLARIAARFRVSIKQLAKWNNLNPKRILKPGQRLTMYVDVTRQT